MIWKRRGIGKEEGGKKNDWEGERGLGKKRGKKNDWEGERGLGKEREKQEEEGRGEKE